ncbi:cytidylate kinase [Propionibacteriaceae bacterium ES.041]|nr:cytidylate kinase [Propionibacteriaceae bacterium ES.041]TDO93115.1 cytidylate kinase [Enemella evansiae]
MLRPGAPRGPGRGEGMITVSDVETDRPLVVAIDGPSGSGKSSTARGVAERLGLAYLDTGAMYRAAAWLVAEQGVTDPAAITELIGAAELDISTDPKAFRISINGHDVTAAIREPRISQFVSTVATIQPVRDILIARQRELIAAATGGVVAEGRDLTTVVAPDATVRVLLVADPQARIARREAELAGAANTAEVTDQIVRRDRDDSTVAAFTEAADGVTVIDSTHLGLTEVIDEISRLTEPPTS